MINSGAITDEKIAELGKAISSKSVLLHNAYLSTEAVFNTDKKSKSGQLLRDYGVVNENRDGISLSREARMIFDRVAKKTYRMQIMPDIESWKMEVALHSERALNAAMDGDDMGNEDAHIDAVSNLVRDLSEALIQEMASIEYSTYSELNNTTTLKDKRVVLNYLMTKIKAQINKAKSLSYEELRKCASDNPKVHMIMNSSINIIVDECLTELGVYLTKITELLNKINKQRKQQDEMVHRLYRGLRNSRYNPDDVTISFNDLNQGGLAVGGINLEPLLNVDTNYNENGHFLLTILDKVVDKTKEKSNLDKTPNVYTDAVLEKEQDADERALTAEQQCAYDFLSYNSENSWSENLSVYEYWVYYSLSGLIEYKGFLALILHQCGSDFKTDNIVNKEHGYEWKLYLKTVEPIELCDTVFVQDARYFCYETQGLQPNKDALWIKN